MNGHSNKYANLIPRFKLLIEEYDKHEISLSSGEICSKFCRQKLETRSDIGLKTSHLFGSWKNHICLYDIGPENQKTDNPNRGTTTAARIPQISSPFFVVIYLFRSPCFCHLAQLMSQLFFVEGSPSDMILITYHMTFYGLRK